MKVIITARAVLTPPPEVQNSITKYTDEQRTEFIRKGQEHMRRVLEKELNGADPDALEVSVTLDPDGNGGCPHANGPFICPGCEAEALGFGTVRLPGEIDYRGEISMKPKGCGNGCDCVEYCEKHVARLPEKPKPWTHEHDDQDPYCNCPGCR